MSDLSSLLLTRIRFFLLALLLGFSLPTLAAPLHLQINGSNTIGAQLAPQLVEGMLHATGASEIQIQLNQQTREHRITATSSESHAIEAPLFAHGSSTAFSGLVEGSDWRSLPAHPPGWATCSAQKPSRLSVWMGSRSPFTLITNWRELDDPTDPIKLYARDSNAGTWETFPDLVLIPGQLELNSNAKRFTSTNARASSVRTKYRLCQSDRHSPGQGHCPVLRRLFAHAAPP